MEIVDRQTYEKMELLEVVEMSPNTLAKLGINEDVSMDVLRRICEHLQCDIGDIMEMVPEKDEEQLIEKKQIQCGSCKVCLVVYGISQGGSAFGTDTAFLDRMHCYVPGWEIGVFRLESQMLPGNGKFDRTGLGSDRDCKEATNTAYSYLKANGGRISGTISVSTKDYVINYHDLQGLGMTSTLALPTLIAICSIALRKPVQSSLAVLGEISISGTMIKVENLADTLQVCLDSGAKKVLLPQTSAVDLGTVPPDLMSSFNLIFYQSAEDAVFKALGVE